MTNLDDMTQGYLDGFRDDRLAEPPSLGNRSHSYCHGWRNGRDDRIGQPRDTAANLRRQDAEAEARDLRGVIWY